MEINSKVIPIFFAVDDDYIPFLAVTLQSLIENSSKDYNYECKVLYTNVSEENKSRILKYESKTMSIEFVDLNYYIEEIQGKLHTRDYYTKTTYYRLFIPNLYPQYNKAIYLDSDITVLGNISELYNEELGNNLVGAVPDASVGVIKEFSEYVERVVGMADYRRYFNAGILLMNLEEMRKVDFQTKFLYLLENVKFSVAQDQDYLNRICKGRTKLLDAGWDVMPLPTDTPRQEKDIKIIHYNLIYKPWHFDNVLYQDYFWKYAKKTEFYKEIMEMRNTYSDESKVEDMGQFKALKNLCKFETECVGNDKKYTILEQGTNTSIEGIPAKMEERLKVLKKIEKLEEEGKFDVDAEEDPPTVPLLKEDVDYLREKRTSRIMSRIANRVGEMFVNDLLKDNKLIIKKINGLEYLSNMETGAVLTCNHFNPFDSMAIEKVFRKSGQYKNRKLYKVIREGNYTNFPGLYGFFFRNCDTLPLSSSTETMVEFMRAVDTILERNDFILMYPEQSMWWNYKKPKPLKNGAFRFAARNMVPVIPIFITMEDSDIIGDDGFPIQEYTINIERPIYPSIDLKEKENCAKMKDRNYEVWKKIYEDFYKVPLEYTTK